MHQRAVEHMGRLAFLLLAASFISEPRIARAAEATILNASRYDVLAGRYSVFAKFHGSPLRERGTAQIWLTMISR
jgi:hypothetical protein